MNNEAAIAVKGLRFAHRGGPFRLDIPELAIAVGERVACIGPSGSGKTTLIHLLSGILLPNEGSIVVAGAELTALSDKERRRQRLAKIGMVFQDFELLEYLSGFDNVLLPYIVSDRLKADDTVRSRARELASKTGIAHVLSRKPHHLSQGERQRVALCRALVTRPPLIVGDEPTGNLDPVTSGQIIDLLFDQVAAMGATLLMVTHDHSLLHRFDRVLDMKELLRS